MKTIEPSCVYGLIYIFRINEETHAGCLKIGSATLKSTKRPDEISLHELNVAAKVRIDSYTSTAGVRYELLHTELAVRSVHNYLQRFTDHDVHSVLIASGIKRKNFDTDKKANEWFITDLETAKNAITAVKEGRRSLFAKEITRDRSPVVFRPEQIDAIEKTVQRFKKSKNMLWNAKMRFGKTLSALEVVKRLKYKRTLIFTHRPVVSDGWFDDFHKIFYENDLYQFGSKQKGRGLDIDTLCRTCSHYIYFASIQDLRGSSMVGGRFEKNDSVFDIEWDCVIIDEAHEGTKTELGENVITAVVKKNTRVLKLSGTPFNLLDDYSEEEIFTWDYIMEQRAKEQWYLEHPGDPNPYESLPRLNIYTYDLDKLLPEFSSLGEAAFNFREFFRTWTGKAELDHRQMPHYASVGDFVHINAIQKFLNLLCLPKGETQYPYSTQEYRNNFRHTLWMLPGVKEAKALSALLKSHPVFGSGAFSIVNVAGVGDDENQINDALQEVRSAIGKNPEDTYSITLSCGRLTTGVSVPEWTAVFMLSGSSSTAASNYLQTIFRVQTPGCIGGKMKTECYVFDFAPDRTLQMIAEAAKISSGAGSTTDKDRDVMSEFLNFCPVISLTGSRMQLYDVSSMLVQLKKAYIERVVIAGFDDKRLYNDKLLQLSKRDIEDFEELRGLIGTTKQSKKIEKITINDQGFTEEEYEKAKRDEQKPPRELTPEQKSRLEKLKELRKNRAKLISVLRGISIRIPLLIYGAELREDEHVTLYNLTSKVDDISWAEFMPQGVDKAMFRKFTKYYDAEIFEGSGVRIRQLAKAADALPIEDRIRRIAEIFSYFRNPDKETVLTPWRVVNMQLSNCLGGYDFFDEEHHSPLENSTRYVDLGDVTTLTVANTEARILEMNSKTGLYSLYVAFCIFRARLKKYKFPDTDKEHQLWEQTLRENVFLICKTKMGRSIATRTLAGFTKAHVNTHCFDDLLMQITSKLPSFLRRAISPRTYGCKILKTDMKFNAIVGNPPYQINDGSGAADDSAVPVYNHFFNASREIAPDYISLIMPSKWMVGGRGLKKFRAEMMKEKRIRKFYDYEDSAECFPGQHIDGGICYFLWDSHYNGKVEYVYKPENAAAFVMHRAMDCGDAEKVIRDGRRFTLIEKVTQQKSFSSIVSYTRPFGIRTYLFNKPDEYKHIKTSTEPFEQSLKIWGVRGIKGGARRVSCYIDRGAITRNVDMIDKYKLLFTTSFSTNAINPPEVIIAPPGTICTETFIVIGPFDTEDEMKNCYDFLQTRFFKVLLYFGKGTMHVNKDVFSYVPLLDFCKKWSDHELFEHFQLEEEEISFINNLFSDSD